MRSVAEESISDPWKHS